MLPQIWPAILTLGWILFAIAAGEGVMALFALATQDGHAEEFAVSAVITALVAGGCVLTTRGRTFELRFRDATLLTVVAWIVVPAFAALPLIAEPVSLPVVDAYFEMVSGITTTGATVMVGLDGVARSVLLWRSTTQWIGGIGIIGFAIVILPFLKIGGMQLFRLEFTERSEKSLPRMRSIATAIVEIYVTLTAACFVVYWMLGMTPFDALNHAMTTICTAGFSTHDASFGYFDSPALEWAAILFMVLGALPFLSLLRMLRAGSLQDRFDTQVTTYLALLVILVAVFALWLFLAVGYPGDRAMTKAAFNVVSIATTTGFTSSDYVLWGTFASVWFFALSFVGGCTGSTAGAIKIFRFKVIYAVIRQHIQRSIYPNAVAPIRYGRRVIQDEQAASVGVFVFIYFVAFAVIAVVMAAFGMGGETSLSIAASAIGNIGPGIGEVVGPTGNFSSLPDGAKIVMCLAMIMGRLEILAVLIMLMPSFYR
ncbi:TrkH family potassium uptake protein [Bauldia litoralis]|uniref:TrkH family potassium uptake protein n=1 Tax=Bauldia litoralis TaxID=665467 RepID=UPI003265671B